MHTAILDAFAAIKIEINLLPFELYLQVEELRFRCTAAKSPRQTTTASKNVFKHGILKGAPSNDRVW